MYYSLTFGTGRPTVNTSSGAVTMPNQRNTWDSWHLIPTSRPVVSPPEANKNFVEIPGRNGALDLSTYLTGGITYKNRTGSFQFYVENDHEYWTAIHDKIANYLHGKELFMIMEDLPNWFWRGRFDFSEWRSENWWSSVTINYTLDPYRYSVFSEGTWLWDPFNFDLDSTNISSDLRRL